MNKITAYKIYFLEAIKIGKFIKIFLVPIKESNPSYEPNALANEDRTWLID